MLLASAVVAAVIALGAPANAQQGTGRGDTAGLDDAMALGAESEPLRSGRRNEEMPTAEIGKPSGVQGRSGRRNAETTNRDTRSGPDLVGGRTGRRADVDRARTGRSVLEYWLAAIGAATIVVVGTGVTFMRRRKR